MLAALSILMEEIIPLSFAGTMNCTAKKSHGLDEISLSCPLSADLGELYPKSRRN